jgi:hypothetical protein
MHQKVGNGLGLCRTGVVRYGLRVQRGWIGIKARSGLDQISDYQANQQRNRGDHFEVEQRLAAYTAYLLHVSHTGDTGNDGAKDHQLDYHGDHAYEGGAEGLHGDRRTLPQIAENDSDRYTDEDLAPESSVEGFLAIRFAACCFDGIIYGHG